MRLWVSAALLLAGCATASDVVDTGNGTYMLSARASAIRGGTTGALSIANADANQFCAERRPGSRAVAVSVGDRDQYQASVGPYGGGTAVSGTVVFRFRCA